MGHHHGHGHGHHGLHGMTRKNNASSSGLAGFSGKKEAKRSHASLANLANEIAAAYEADPAPQGMERSSSRGGIIPDTKQKGRANRETLHQLNPAAATAEDDDGEGWISANSSAAVTPEAGTSPMSPESFKPLEIGKKNRRGKSAAASKNAIPALTFEKQEVVVQRYEPPMEEGEGLGGGGGAAGLGTTPKQTSSLHAPSTMGGLSKTSRSQSNLTRLSEAAMSASDGGDITPSAEGDDSGPPTPRLPPDEAAAARKETNAPTSQQLQQIAESLSPTLPSTQREAQDRPSDLPQPPLANVKPRLANLRKASSSTIRSLTSMNGVRPPLTAGMRKSTAPLQPSLDTKTTGFGEILEQNLSPTESVTGQSFGGAGSRNNISLPSTTAGSNTAGKPKRDRTISGHSSKSNAGTLTAQEAEDLARRLRSVSGTDLHGLDGGGGYGARAALRRSASSTQGYSLSGGGPGSPRIEHASGSSGSGAFGTLKRASGYFGSIGRLTGLTGLTGGNSSGNLSNSPPSPILGGQQTISPAQANLINSSPALRGTNGPASSSSRTKGKQVSISVPTLQQQQQQYRPPPLISKFIEPNTGSQMLFAKQPPQQQQTQSGISSLDSRSRGTVSRARQKMLTQRDAPFPVSQQAQQQQDFYSQQQLTPGRSSDEDPSSSASQLNLRAIRAGSGAQSGQNTPLAQGVHRWLQALAKEMQRIDMDHSSNSRWRDEMNASIARTLVKLEKQEEEERKEMEKAQAEAASASPKT